MLQAKNAVGGGTLAVNNQLGGSLDVLAAGRLQGVGTVGTTVASGTIAPGNSIGTLNVAGNIAFNATSTYEVELNAAGQSDLIKATGAATIAPGAQVQIVKTGAGLYQAGTRYTILEAAGVSGTYTLTGDTRISAFLGFVDHYDPTHAWLDIEQDRSFTEAANTRNQVAVAGALDGLSPGSILFNAVASSQTDASARMAFDQLSGEVHASAKGVMIEDSRFVREAALDRLRSAFDGAGAASAPVMSCAGGEPALAPATTKRCAVWGQGFGSWGRFDGDGNAASLKRDIGGVFLGGDGFVTETWRLGVLAGYSRSDFRIRDRSSSGTSDNYHLGLYGGTQWGALAVRSGAAVSWHDISTRRAVAFPGFADSLEADEDARTAQAFGELGYDVKAGGFAFEPFANLAYVNLATDGFTEAGGAAALAVRGDDTDVTVTTLGLRASSDFRLGGVSATARGTLGWRHAFGDTTPLATVAFAGGAPFTIAGVPIAQDAAVVEAGLDFALTSAATLGVSYGGQFGSDLSDQSVRANLNWKF